MNKSRNHEGHRSSFLSSLSHLKFLLFILAVSHAVMWVFLEVDGSRVHDAGIKHI